MKIIKTTMQHCEKWINIVGQRHGAGVVHLQLRLVVDNGGVGH